MKFSYQWLCELVPGLTTEPAELQRLITMKTAECEGIQPVGAHFNNVAAARIVSIDPLTQGKNKLVTIEIGDGKTARVVCGASNVRVGLIAPWVPPGTILGEKTIRRSVIEGVESEGMLASAAELHISRDHSGVLELDGIQPGERLDKLSPDWVIEIDNKSLTHRPDLWGHFGMAREVAAVTGCLLEDPVHSELLPSGAPMIKVEIADYALCPRYSALFFENAKVGPSPLWLQARLESLGLNPINNIVDVTNYILAELPQPMHAFDADKLTGDTIFVRPAREGEHLQALNGETYKLDVADLVIADSAGPIGLAGVIGGSDSAISETTRRVILESANFLGSSVRVTAARHKLRTDASMRFEKSLDPENTLRGLARAVELFSAICPDIRVRGGPTDNLGPLPSSKPILLPVSFVSRKLGKEISEETICQILIALGFSVSGTAPGLLAITVPTWRATKDISIKDDLVEEIGRMVGYEEITPSAPLMASVVPPSDPMRAYLRQVRAQLTAQGFTEVYNYSFVNDAEAKRFLLKGKDQVAIENPIASELTHLRRSLLPGVFKNVIQNIKHFREFRMFEIGKEIHAHSADALPTESTHVVAALYNIQGDEQDFFELKRVVECLFPRSLLNAVEARAYEHPARTAEIRWHDCVLGRIFELHPSLLQEEGAEGRVMLFDVDLETAQRLDESRAVSYTPLRKYPTSGFDLSVVADLKTPVQRIQDHVTKFAGPDLASIDFVRQYAGPPLLEKQKSVSYHLEVGALNHTMTTEEVSQIRNRIIQGMQELGFDLRV
ncbi:MAG: phenylalanine--tRNA ligase subunit beta [Bryobacteraceae bacterium]